MRIRTLGRTMAVLAAVVLVASGCNLQRRGTGPEQELGPSSVGEGVKLPPEIQEALEQPEEEPPPTDVTPPKTGGTDKGETAPGPPPPPPESFVPVGEAHGIDLARRIVSGSTPRLLIEVAAVEGTAPNPQALGQFVNYISTIVDKPGGIEVLPIKTIPRQSGPYDSQKVFEAMYRHRTTDNRNADVASVWILYVPELGGAAGVAWFGANGVIAINHSSVNGTGAAAVGGPTRMERAVLTHEFGHVMSLVNMAYKSPRDHEDPRNRGHSKNTQSVMYYAVELINPGNVIQGGTPIEFDADDIADLRDVADGKLG